MEEQWKPVVGFEGLYEVSDLGRVRSLTREVTVLRYGKHYVRIKIGKSISTPLNTSGYCSLNLHKIVEGKGHSCPKRVHCLVMEAFAGPRPKGYHIDHLNRDRSDSRLCNLEYVTHRENCARGLRGDLHPNKTCKFRGVTNPKKLGRFVVRKKWGSKSYNLGTYDDGLEASEVYVLATYEDMLEIKKFQCIGRRSKFNILNFLRERHELMILTGKDPGI